MTVIINYVTATCGVVIVKDAQGNFKPKKFLTLAELETLIAPYLFRARFISRHV